MAALIDTLYLAGKEEKCFLIPLRMYPVTKSLTWIQAVQSHRGISLKRKVFQFNSDKWESLEKLFRKLFCFSYTDP